MAVAAECCGDGVVAVHLEPFIPGVSRQGDQETGLVVFDLHRSQLCLPTIILTHIEGHRIVSACGQGACVFTFCLCLEGDGAAVGGSVWVTPSACTALDGER